MKPTTFLILLILITSCSAPKLYQQGMKKIEKAVKKDPSIKLPSDTTVITKTITEIDTVDNEIIKTVTNTITITKDTCNFATDLLKTNKQLRWERRVAKDSLKHSRKMYRLETNRLEDSLKALVKVNKELTKQVKDTNNKEEKLAKEETKQKKGNWLTRFFGRIWWLLLIIGFVLGVYFSNFIKKVVPFLNRNIG
jgi:lysyl-tRNA synthetase class I